MNHRTVGLVEADFDEALGLPAPTFYIPRAEVGRDAARVEPGATFHAPAPQRPIGMCDVEREFPWLWAAYLLAVVLGAFAPPVWKMLK